MAFENWVIDLKKKFYYAYGQFLKSTFYFNEKIDWLVKKMTLLSKLAKRFVNFLCSKILKLAISQKDPHEIFSD